MVWYGLVWFGMVWFCVVWFCLVSYGMVWFDMVWFGLVWPGFSFQKPQPVASGQINPPKATGCSFLQMLFRALG